MGNLKQATGKIEAQLRAAHKFVSRTLCSVALVLEQPLYENYATLYSHTNTVISHPLSYMSRP